jgi:hypothetical protein
VEVFRKGMFRAPYGLLRLHTSADRPGMAALPGPHKVLHKQRLHSLGNLHAAAHAL